MLIALGTVIVGALAFIMLGGQQDDSATTGTTAQGSSGPRFVPRPTLTTSAFPVPVQTNGFDAGSSAKDPFEPPGGYVRPGGTNVPGPSGSPGPGSTATPTAQPTGGVPGRSKVVLLDVYSQKGTRFASVRINSEIHNVKEGDTFAGTYRVVTITEKCATFVQGDERFTLCIGQQVFK